MSDKSSISDLRWKEAGVFATGFSFCSPCLEDGLFDWDTLAQSKLTFLTHCPVNREFIARCHGLGIRCFPYVVFYMGSPQMTLGPGPAPPFNCPPSPPATVYEGVRWADHEDWYERDQAGLTRPWQFHDSPDGVGVHFTNPQIVCPNVEGYQQAMVAWVSYLMEQGADGIFIDVLQVRDPCHGQQLGFHQHIIADNPSNFPIPRTDPLANQNQAFELLLRRVREAVKRHRPNGFVWGNSGNPLCLPTPEYQYPTLPEFEQYLDGDMIEHYIVQGQVQPDGSTTIVQSAVWQGDNKTTWDQLGQELQAYLERGKRILALSDMGSSKGYREDAFLCFASARLAGFTWYGLGLNSLADPAVADLYRLDLGQPVTSQLVDSTSGVNFRVFERGLVVVNWDPANAKTLVIQSSPIVATSFYDLFSYSPPPPAACEPCQVSTVLIPPDGPLLIPAMSGRVYLFGSDTDFGLNRLL